MPRIAPSNQHCCLLPEIASVQQTEHALKCFYQTAFPSSSSFHSQSMLVRRDSFPQKRLDFFTLSIQYGLKKKEEKEAEEKAAMEQACEGSLTRPKKAIPRGCGDDEEEDEESILDTVLKFLPGPLQDMFKK